MLWSRAIWSQTILSYCAILFPGLCRTRTLRHSHSQFSTIVGFASNSSNVRVYTTNTSKPQNPQCYQIAAILPLLLPVLVLPVNFSFIYVIYTAVLFIYFYLFYLRQLVLSVINFIQYNNKKNYSILCSCLTIESKIIFTWMSSGASEFKLSQISRK